MRNRDIPREEEHRSMTSERSEYEREKQKLMDINLPWGAFQRRLRELMERLGI